MGAPSADPNSRFLQNEQSRLNRIKRAARRFNELVGQSLIVAIYWLPAAILALTNYRFLRSSVIYRIGHMFAEPDCYIRKQHLGLIPDYRTILLVSGKKVANQALLDILKQHFIIIQNKIAYGLLKPLALSKKIGFNMFDDVGPLYGAAKYYDVIARSWHLDNIWSLTDEMESNGCRALKEMGLKEGDWFVCVHARDAGYSPHDEDAHGYRNSDIGTYGKAINLIIEKGGWVIRVGDPAMNPIKPRERVIDYPHTKWKATWMDLFLGAHCRFFVGNSSGLCVVSTAFGRPCVLANMIPYGACLGFGPEDICIPKLIKNAEGNILNFKDIFSSEIAHFRYGEMYLENAIEIIDTPADEIHAAVGEMLDQLEADPDKKALTAAQKKFRGLMNNTHYSFYARATISEYFLKKHANLL